MSKEDDKSLEVAFYEVYTKFKLNFYRNIFTNFENREASLTVIENFCAEAIYALNEPTINELADFINISQPNAAYKVANLVRKGYIKKVQSKEDKREYKLLVTDKFKKYYRINYDYVIEIGERMKHAFTDDELVCFKKILNTISNDLMTEVNRDLKREPKVDL